MFSFVRYSFYLLSISVLLLVVACDGEPDKASTTTATEQFADLGAEKDFKEAHETPGQIDKPMDGQMIEFSTPDGKTGSAYALSTGNTAAPMLLVIHEWYGLNDHIKREAERLFKKLGAVNVMALDIYDGKVADNPDKASEYMQAVEEERAEAIIRGAIAHAGENTAIGTIGWCFGGGWSLRASLLAGDQAEACVIYYGMPITEQETLKSLKAPVMGLFAEKDEWITPEIVNEFEAAAKAVGIPIETQQFDAEHAFANPSSPRYQEEAAQKANAMAMQFLEYHLR